MIRAHAGLVGIVLVAVGLLSYPVNAAGQLMPIGLAAISFLVAWTARSRRYTTATA